MGNIAAPNLIIQEGAIFEGRCSMRHELDANHKVHAES
jgi:cytoskeletal protein CcmA (bactofilin family)